MSRDALDMLLDEYDEWADERSHLLRGYLGDAAVKPSDWQQSDDAAVTLLVRLVGEVQASNRVLPNATTARSGEGAPPILLATLDAMGAGA